MTNSATRIPVFVIAVSLAVALYAGCDSEKKKEEQAAKPAMSVLALPVSLRTGSPAPGDANVIELDTTAISVNGKKVIEIKDDEIPAAEISGDLLPKLKSALASPARSTVAMEVNASTPYIVLALALNTAQSAGVRNAAFKVRKLGGVADIGWMALNGFKVVQDTEDEVTFDTVTARPWNDFVNVWDEVYMGCSSGSSGNCIQKTVKVAEGGNLQMVLFAAGDGVNIEFNRMGGPTIEQLTEALEAKPEEERAEVLKGMPPEVIEGYMALPFAERGGFQFRSREAVVSPSAVSSTMAPVCGKMACAALMKGEKSTLSVRVLQLLGAAFPDGTPAPTIGFVIPAR